MVGSGNAICEVGAELAVGVDVHGSARPLPDATVDDEHSSVTSVE